MKRHWIEYRPIRTHGPMTFWVHREADGKPWYRTKVYDPPLEPAIPAKGFPIMFVEYRDFTFLFTSLAELRVAIDVLGRKLLPTTRRLSHDRHSGMGPNRHWLGRLPGHVTPWRYREPAVAYLAVALSDFERELGRPAG
jgi:hypothetical protein